MGGSRLTQRDLERMMKPPLTDAQWSRLLAFGEPQEVAEGEYLFEAGDLDYDLILVDSGEIELVRVSFGWVDETPIGRMGPRSFVGELGLLNGQGAFLSARAAVAGRMLRVSRAQLRLLMAEDDELCDIVLHALWARREMLRRGPAALTLKLVGPRSSREFMTLRRFAERVDLVHTAIELPPGDLGPLGEHGITLDDLPVAFIQGEPMARATPGAVAERLGLS
jgi:thioredoxin reductase (NADPH)